MQPSRLVPVLTAPSQVRPIVLNHQLARRWRGFTLVELMITVAILALLVSVAVPAYLFAINKSRTSDAKKDIMTISVALEQYYTRNGRLPPALTEVFSAPDPWGRPYRYLDMDGASVGQKRKDKSLHPLNTDYDLYSVGPDGQSSTPLTARASRDDIIRANNGGFIGVAEDY